MSAMMPRCKGKLAKAQDSFFRSMIVYEVSRDLNQFPENNVKSTSMKDTAAGEGAQRVAGGHHPFLPDRRRGLRPHLRHLPREGVSGTGLG